MSLTCPTHGATAKMIPGGVSKATGKPYDAFWACSFKGCREKLVDAAAGAPAPRQASAPAPTPQGQPRAAQAASGGCSERTLLLLACLDYASRLYQGTGDNTQASAVAYELWTRLKGEVA
jgi:hypothetical protein